MPLIFLVQESLVSKVALSKKEKKRKPEIGSARRVFPYFLFGAHYPSEDQFSSNQYSRAWTLVMGSLKAFL